VAEADGVGGAPARPTPQEGEEVDAACWVGSPAAEATGGAPATAVQNRGGRARDGGALTGGEPVLGWGGRLA
jgi:hypothetical protein